MKIIYVFTIFTFCLLSKINAQKLPIDTAAFGKWPYVHGPGISNNGKYVTFFIVDSPLHKTTFVVKSADGSWKKQIIGASSPKFTGDSKQLIISLKDTLFKIHLGSDKVEVIADAGNFSLIGDNWMVYRQPSIANRLIIVNLKGLQKDIINDVADFYVIPGEKSIVLKRISNDKVAKQQLEIYNLQSHSHNNIWEGESADHVIFDQSGNQMAFLSTTESGKTSLEYYSIPIKKIKTLIDSTFSPLDSLEYSPYGSYYRFSNDGRRIFFTLSPKQASHQTKQDFDLTIWNYKDAKLQTDQANTLHNPVEYIWSVSLSTHQPLQLTQQFERTYGNIKFASDKNDNFIVAERIEGNVNEWYWNPAAMQQVILISTVTGKRTVISPPSKFYLKLVEVSPEGKYVIYYDSNFANYFCYEINTSKKYNLTGKIFSPLNTYISDKSMNIPAGLCGWLPNDKSVLINGQTDIWIIDLTQKTDPKKVTSSKINKEIFSLVIDPNNRVFKTDEKILLQSVDIDTKNFRFYDLTLGKQSKLTQLSSGPYLYQTKFLFYRTIYATDLAKAKNAHSFIIMRQSASESPNYFYTQDFKRFKDITGVYPESRYQWIKSELHTYTLSNGQKAQGILYKPENFDSTKRYPVILYYYDYTSSFELNKFYYPEAHGGIINFPWYTANEYLIFRPDIVFDSVKTAAESALESVTSAASYLKTKPWINEEKMGIQGHSAGGFETNYIISHTNMFAAAMEGAGMSNLISMYGSIWSGGDSQQNLYEVGIYRMRGNLWDKQQSYLSNSPILSADKITTPLLMMHNTLDGSVPYSEAQSFFITLRRLQKKVWWLQYANENHVIDNKYARMDYAIRVKQFFDHYLQNKPEPIWMSKGIPAKLKGTENGLKLED